ncbi:MAG: asparagine synthase (glutamine-hydrolyzing) [Candidatus Paceibacterota bacterium]
MCGIAGILGNNIKNKEEVIKKMTDIMIHRGPDDSGFFIDENAALGMRRLSIIDLSTGHQPIFSEDGNLVIIFNGEIYNYKELEKNLIDKGHKFKTKSDTEVLVHLYEEEGEMMLNKLRGMFTFCIYDKKKKTAFLARDFFGIKPLYFLRQGGMFAFASEIKSLLRLPDYKPEVNDEAVFHFLSFQYVPTRETMFKNIYRLPASSYLKINIIDDKMEEKTYWEFDFNQKAISEKDAKEKLLDILGDSVSCHMISDVPVGAFLSGGIDSTAIVALMKSDFETRSRTSGKTGKIHTFSIGFDEINEFEDARRAAKYLGTDHHEIKISPREYFDKLPDIFWHFDEPVADPSAVALYFVARETAKKVKVVLSGEGADELFGGYNIYLEPFALKKLNIIPKFLREKILRPIAGSKLNFFGKNYLRRYFTSLEERFIGNARVFQPKEIFDLWQGEKFRNPSDLTKKYYQKAKNISDSEKMQYIDINFWLIGDILAKADKMTMANSLELRVPFLDIEVAKISSILPPNLKFRGNTTKYLLRESMKGIIPEQNREKKKLGFPVPLKQWFRDKNNNYIFGTIKENKYIREKFNKEIIEQLFNDHLSGKKDNSRKIYLLLSLAIWYNIFIKNGLL